MFFVLFIQISADWNKLEGWCHIHFQTFRPWIRPLLNLRLTKLLPNPILQQKDVNKS